MSIPFGQFNHANLVYRRVVSAVAPGTDYILQVEAAVHCVSVTGEITNIKFPALGTSPFGPSIFFIRWNGHGTLTFSVVAGSTDAVSGDVNYVEASPVNPVDFIVLALESSYRIIALHEGSAAGAVNEVAPNIQVVGNTVDAGHKTAAGTLHFARTAGTAAPTLQAGAICLGDANGRSHGFRSVTMGTLLSNVSDDSIAIGDLGAGAVAANSQLVGQAVGLGAQSRVLGMFENVGIGCSLVGEGLDAGDLACVLGNATGNVPAGAIVLGTGAASATANRLNLLNIEAEVANTTPIVPLPLDFMTVNLNGNTRYVPVRSSPSWNNAGVGVGTVTSVSGASGIVTTPNPITGAGTVSLDTIANNTVLGNNSGGAAVPTAKTGTEVTALLDTFATGSATKGVVPGSNSAGASAYLNGTGGWTVPSGTEAIKAASTFIYSENTARVAKGAGSAVSRLLSLDGGSSTTGAIRPSAAAISTTWRLATTIYSTSATWDASTGNTTAPTTLISDTLPSGGSVSLTIAYVNVYATSSFTTLATATITSATIGANSSCSVTWSSPTVTLPAYSRMYVYMLNNLTGASTCAIRMLIGAYQE